MKRNRVVLTVAGLGLVVAVGYAVRGWLASDADRIRVAVHDAAAGFDAMHLSRAIAPFDESYREHTSPQFDYTTLQQALRYLFFHELDARKQFALRVHVEPSEFEVAVAPDDPEAAEARFHLRLERRNGETWKMLWELDVEAALRKTPQGWRIVRSRHTTTGGGMPR
ncbi:MAG: hypothetical protein H6837_13585 [Planctomycetes bacterium]|nr:hypothetical protein [Planctomycetota bacterium]